MLKRPGHLMKAVGCSFVPVYSFVEESTLSCPDTQAACGKMRVQLGLPFLPNCMYATDGMHCAGDNGFLCHTRGVLLQQEGRAADAREWFARGTQSKGETAHGMHRSAFWIGCVAVINFDPFGGSHANSETDGARKFLGVSVRQISQSLSL
eukprot:scaffold139341_cov17-Tisochrysis_lutea.AAC.1